MELRNVHGFISKALYRFINQHVQISCHLNDIMNDDSSLSNDTINDHSESSNTRVASFHGRFPYVLKIYFRELTNSSNKSVVKLVQDIDTHSAKLKQGGGDMKQLFKKLNVLFSNRRS